MPKQRSFFDTPPPSYPNLDAARRDCLNCTRCRLSRGRRQVVFGAGNPGAKLMLIGQGPSQSDDQTGKPYTGPSGNVLDKALAEVGLSRSKVWITNIHKCLSFDYERRKLRSPRSDELESCRPWLEAEIDLVSPEVIVCLGGPAAQEVIDTGFKLSEQRGQWYRSRLGQIKTVATFQPAYLMRLKTWNPTEAKTGWEALLADLHLAVAEIQ